MKAELMAALLHHPKVLFLDEPTLDSMLMPSGVTNFARQQTIWGKYLFNYTTWQTSPPLASGCFDSPRATNLRRWFGSVMTTVPSHREVQLELAHPMSEAELSAYGESEAVEGQSVLCAT